MSRLKLARFLGAMAVVVVAGCQVRIGEKEEAPAKAATPIEASALQHPFSLSDYTGKVVLVDFWATWCAPCRSEIPALNKIQEDFKDRPFAMVGLSLDRGEPADIAQAVSRLGVGYPVVLADDKLVADFGGVRAVPTKFLVDKQGKVRKSYVGVAPPEEIRAQVMALLSE